MLTPTLTLNRTSIIQIVTGCVGTGTAGSYVFLKRASSDSSNLLVVQVLSTGSFSSLVFNLELSQNNGTSWSISASWDAVANPSASFSIAENVLYRLNCASFIGGTGVSVEAVAASGTASGAGEVVTANQGAAGGTPWLVTGTVTAAEASVGPTGATAPTSATEIGIVDNAGKLQGASSTNPIRIDPTGTTIQPVDVMNLPASQIIVGNLTHNHAAPAATQVGVLCALANNIAPLYIEGDQVLLSTDLNGNLRVLGTFTGTVTAVNPSVSSLNAAIPSSGTLVAGSDGTDLRALVTDTCGRLKTVSSTPLGADLVAFAFNQLETNFSVAFSSAWITNSIVTTGTHTQANGQATYGTGTGAAGEGKGVSVQALEYRPGHTWYSLFTAVFGTPAASSYQRIGPYNSTDGFWIGYEGTTFGLTSFLAGAATQTAKASWNGDPLDGSAGSKFTSNGSPVAWNPQKGNIYRFQGSWFGFAPVELDILSPDGTWVTAHTFRNPNTLTSPYAATTNWNMTIDVANTGNTSNITTSTACWAMGTLDQNTIVSSTVTDQTLAQSVRAVLCGKGPSGYANVATDGANNLYVSVYNMPGIASPGAAIPGSLLVAGALVNSAAPSYTDAKIEPPSLDTAGNLRVALPSATVSTLTPPTAAAIASAIVSNPPTTFGGAVTNAGTFAVQAAATLAAETTKVIGTVRALGNAGAIFDGATAATAPANAVQIGNRGTTALPTAVTDGQLVAPLADKYGRQVSVLNSIRSLLGTASVQSTSASPATFITAGGTGVYNDILELILTNESATATIVSISDGSTTYKFALAGNGGLTKSFANPLVQAGTATNWTISNSAAVNVDALVVFRADK